MKKVVVCCIVLLLIGIAAYKIIAPPLNDEIKETPEARESEVKPDAGGDIIIYEPSGEKTRPPVSGMFFVEDGKVVDPPANLDDFPYGLKVYYSDTATMTEPAIQFVTVYYFKTKEERSAFRPEQHER